MKNIIKKISKIIFALFIGIFITLLFLEITLRIIGWYQANKNSFTKIDNKPKNELRILALGDSMTALGGDTSYPIQLEKILNDSKKIDKKVNVINGGVVTSTSTDTSINFISNIDKYKPQVVVVMSGFNDYIEPNYKNIQKQTGNDIYQNTLYKTESLNNQNEFFSRFKVYRLFTYIFNNVREIDNLDYVKLVEVGNSYSAGGDVSNALDYYIKAIIKDPQRPFVYNKLFQYLHFLPPEIRFRFCEMGYKKNPNNYESNYCMRLRHMGNYPEGLAYLKKLEIKFPGNTQLLLAIARLAYSNKEFDTSHEYLIKALSAKDNFSKKQVLDLLVKVNIIEGNTVEADKTLNQFIALTEETRINFQKIATICKSHNIQLVVVQYPRRNVNILKSYLSGFTNTYFVDNNQSFEDAVAKYGFDKVFIDAFAGDFGHGSPLGNKIIAENVAKVILDKVLKK